MASRAALAVLVVSLGVAQSPDSDTRRARIPPPVRAVRDGFDIEFRFPRLQSPHAPFFGLKIRSLAVTPE